MFDLHGRIAVITGGSRGIGFAIAEALGRAGAKIAIAARDQEHSERAVANLVCGGIQATGFCTDVTDESACSDLFVNVGNTYGGVDIVVNNAGINVRKPPQDLSLVEWSSVISTNLTGAFVCSRAAFSHMRARAGGKIINVASILGVLGDPLFAAYCASKGGLIQLTRSLAVAWAADNIQVNALLPGWIDTDLSRAGRNEVPDRETVVLARSPAGRWGTPADLAGAAVFLASSASDFMTGSCLTIDGGYSAH